MEMLKMYLPVYVSVYCILWFLFKFIRALTKVLAIFICLVLFTKGIDKYFLAYINSEIIDTVRGISLIGDTSYIVLFVISVYIYSILKD